MDPNSNTAQIQQDPYYGNDDGGGLFGSKKRILLLILGVLIFIGIAFGAIWFFFLRNGSESSDEEVTLLYWGVWEDVEVLQPVFDKFESENPNITIQYEKMDIKTLGDYVDRLQTRTAEGNGPDIMRFHSSWLLQVQDILAPFPEDVVAETGLEENYFDVVQRDLKRNGAYYGLPLSIDTLALYVNSDIFQTNGVQIPTNWNDIDDIAPELTIVEGQDIIQSGVALGTYDNIAHAPDIISLLFLVNGANIEDLAGERMDKSESALKFYTQFSSGSDAVWSQTLDNSKIEFASGNLAMYFGYSWDIFEIEAANPNLNYDIVPVPSHLGIENTIASYWVEGVSNQSEHQEAAFKFMKFLGQDETLQMIYENQVKARGHGAPYPKRNLAQSVENNNTVSPFLARADDAASTFFSSDTYDAGLNEEMNIYLGNAVRSIINDNTSYESAIETLASGVRQVLSRYEEQGTDEN